MRWWVALSWVFVVGCGAPPAPVPTVFIALERDFQGYASWESARFDGPALDTAHVAGERTVYLNQRPPAGATSWPVGTVFVKELGGTTFAMSKRGAYNEAGAKGWEWFELARDTNGTLRIKWRGLGPPVGEEYSDSEQTCNDCHRGATANDSVMSTAFRLSP